MKHTPVAISLLLCEQVIVDEKTRNVTPVNCFSTRKVEVLPGLATFYALAWLTDGIGEMPIELTVERLDTMEDRAERVLRFVDPLSEMRCMMRIRNCHLPIRGSY